MLHNAAKNLPLTAKRTIVSQFLFRYVVLNKIIAIYNVLHIMMHNYA